MRNIFRRCPSGRIASGNLVRKSTVPGSELIAQEFFETGNDKSGSASIFGKGLLAAIGIVAMFGFSAISGGGSIVAAGEKPSGGNITRVGTEVVQSSAVTSSASITIPADCDFVLVGIGWGYTPSPTAPFTYCRINSVDMTLIGGKYDGGDFMSSAMYRLNNPATGSQTFSWSYPQSIWAGFQFCFTYFKGVDLDNPVRDWDGYSGYGTTGQVILDTVANDACYLMVAAYNCNPNCAPTGSGQIEISNPAVFNSCGASVGEEIASGVSTTLSFTEGESSSETGVALKPASGAEEYSGIVAISGNGYQVAVGDKAGAGTGIITGSGAVSSTEIKGGQDFLLISGSGLITVIGEAGGAEEYFGVALISGGGSVVSSGTAVEFHFGVATVSNNGLLVVSAAKGGQEVGWLSGNGALTTVDIKAATSTVFVLGNGSITAIGAQEEAFSGVVLISGGGYLLASGYHFRPGEDIERLAVRLPERLPVRVRVRNED